MHSRSSSLCLNRCLHHVQYRLPYRAPVSTQSKFTSRSRPQFWTNPDRSLSRLSVSSNNDEKSEIDLLHARYKRDLRAEVDDESIDWQQMLKEKLNEEGIILPRYKPGEYRILCPKCDGGSTGEISLSVTIDESNQCALFNCFRAKCAWHGRINTTINTEGVFPKSKKEIRVEKPRPRFQPLDEECIAFFKQRGIPQSVLDRNKIQMEIKWGKKFIAFPYILNGELVNVKYRGVESKEFIQVKGAMKVWYGLDDVQSSKEIIIVEGEMDKLSLEAAGFTNVVSVPDGAPGRVKEQSSRNSESSKFSYVSSGSDVFEQSTKIILATDNDESGLALAEELSRRLGVWKCWKVRWPSNCAETMALSGELFELTPEKEADDALWFRKDANEVLVKDGTGVLKAYLSDPEPYPVTGLLRFMDFFDDIRDRYVMKTMCPSGFSIGWPGLDKFYKVVPGELSVVSGVPNSGKSEWLDAVAVKLAEQYGWSIAFASMEKMASDHARQLIEKHIRKPFYSSVYYADNQPRMTGEEAEQGIQWIDDKFPLIKRNDDELPTMDWILDTAKTAVMRYGIRGLVIDPYNELDHGRKTGTTETEFVSIMLSKIKNFARKYDVHVWLVAHPRQLHDWRGEPPNLYDISGSAHFVNKADAGIVVHRNWQKASQRSSSEEYSDEDQYLVRIIIQKMRNKAAGRVGSHILLYNPVNGTYSDPQQSESPPVKQEYLNGNQYHS
eukprot:g7586.t1